MSAEAKKAASAVDEEEEVEPSDSFQPHLWQRANFFAFDKSANTLSLSPHKTTYLPMCRLL
jgi:hypothetical protein